MSLHDSFLKLKFDKRMEAWNLNQGLVTEKEIKETLENLPDVSENANPMVLFPNPSESTDTDQEPSQTPQVQQEEPSDETNDTAHNTQPPSVTDQVDPQKAQVAVAVEEKTVNKEENVTQKSSEDPSNPWW